MLDGISTEPVSGQHDWIQVGTDVTIRPNSPSEEVQVIRRPSLNFDGKLRGVAWIDNVELRQIQ